MFKTKFLWAHITGIHRHTNKHRHVVSIRCAGAHRGMLEYQPHVPSRAASCQQGECGFVQVISVPGWQARLSGSCYDTLMVPYIRPVSTRTHPTVDTCFTPGSSSMVRNKCTTCDSYTSHGRSPHLQALRLVHRLAEVDLRGVVGVDDAGGAQRGAGDA